MGTRGGAITAAAASDQQRSERIRIKVLYDFEYDFKGKRVKIIKDEKLLLLKKTNEDWWQVVRPADVNNFYVPEQCTFYVPTGYVIEEEPLPESTRFYVDKEKMFKSTDGTSSNSSGSSGNNINQHSHTQEKQSNLVQEVKEQEPRKAHDSFRSVIRKLSGNLTSHNDSNKSNKPTKPSKIIKSLRMNSVDSEDGTKIQNSKSSLIPSKNKDTWESSAFGMCFGRDMKNVDAQVLNPFQEELENALSSRVFQKKPKVDPKVDVSESIDQVSNEEESVSKYESIHNKWEKVSSQVKKKPETSQKSDNFNFVPLSKIKEDALKRRSASPNYPKSDVVNNSKFEVKELTETEKLEKLYSVVEKNKRSQLLNKTTNSSSKPIDNLLPVTDDSIKEKTNDETDDKSNEKITNKVESLTVKDKDRLFLNDERRMWAIETLMSELIQSSAHSKSTASAENNVSGISGPNQLAQELHEMNVSRRFENAEIQVNLLDNKNENTKENEPQTPDDNSKMNSWKRKVFDFPPRSSLVKVPKSPTARSPKLLDEYNEANILNDNDRPRSIQDIVNVGVLDYHESPSYSSISLRIKREKVPCKLKMPTKDFREELQLTPSLEKLASEIKFLPASANSTDLENEKHYFDTDYPVTTLSQDSLRLYKRRSKSDGALNLQHQLPRRRDSSHRVNSIASSTTANQAEIHHPVERKYEAAPQRKHDPSDYHPRGTRYNKLNRKSRSLGDLDCSDELDEKKEAEAKRRYKPVPKLRSKESLRRVRPTGVQLVTSTSSSERLAAANNKPVPAKRRIQPYVAEHYNQPLASSSYDELSSIDIDRSTAVGFKSLLRTSDSGSEEYLQYKNFPANAKPPYDNQSSNYEEDSMCRSLSDEAILSSASCSSASPSRLLDGSVENLVDLPAGWTQTYDVNAKRMCFVNDRGDKWFSSNDTEGKIYFFEENSNESSWALPAIANETRIRTVSNENWPQLFDGNMKILKEGVINKTKITTEHDKKLRKAWSSSYAVLTELFLLFFKDEKTITAMRMNKSSTAAKPDISVDLNGAFIESAEKLSNRKNVYLIQTLLGLQVLIQSDNLLVSTEWHREIQNAIQKLPFSQEYKRSLSLRD